MDVAAKSESKIKDIPRKVCLSCHRQFEHELTHCPTDKTALVTPNPDPLANSNLASQYEIESVIGSGGWSLVYRAKQRSLGRRVAIKILHSHLMLDPDKVVRFQREAEAASKFNHPTIPSVYDFGILPSGQPYMVMAYVEGRSLSEIIRDDGPMSFEDAIDAFTQTASGLAIAHERGIVHRDIKPSNILITKEKHEVKILDFGLAKLVAAPEGEALATLTQAGHTIGTPAYMSPEQCLGVKLDARSDIYSLGCVMYETVTGIRPFEGKDAFEAMSLHMRGDVSFDAVPNRAQIPDHAQECILKALAKNPAERFQSADELLAALRRVQSENYYQRRPLRFVHPLIKIFKQRGSGLATNTASLAVTVLVIITLVVGAIQTVRFVNANGGKAPHNVAELYKENMARGERQFYAGNFTKSTEYFKRSLELAENFGAGDERLEAVFKRLDLSLRKENKLDEAKKLEEKHQALTNSTYGLMYGTSAENARTIITLSAKREADPNDVDVARQLCAVLNNQAALLFTQSNVPDAKQFLDRAIEIEKKVLGEQDPEYATSVSNMAYYHAQRGDSAQAEKLYQEALDLRKKILGSDSPKVGRSLRNLADFYWQQGDVKRAQELMSQSMQVYKKGLPTTSAEYAWTVNNLALIEASQRQYPSARALFSEALKIRKELYGESGLDVGRTLHNMAQLDTAERNYADAEAEYRTAQKIYDTKLGTEHPDTLKCVSNLATMYYNQGNFGDAEPLLKRVLAVQRAKHTDEGMEQAAIKLLSQMYQQQNRPDALKELQQSSVSETERRR